MEEYIRAFRLLSSQRVVTEIPQAISLSDIRAYVELYDPVDGPTVFIDVIVRMDRAFLSAQNKKREAPDDKKDDKS